MKWTCYIFSLWVLLMSAIPCADGGEVVFPSENDKSSLIAHDFHGGHDHQNECDLCSPFCICTCCSGFPISKVYFFEFNPSFYFGKKLLSCYRAPSHAEYVSHHWQPPRFA